MALLIKIVIHNVTDVHCRAYCTTVGHNGVNDSATGLSTAFLCSEFPMFVTWNAQLIEFFWKSNSKKLIYF